METNYELKNKRILVPPKALWMVLAMVLFGLFSFAQQGKTIKVANDQQLREAVENSSVSTVIFGSDINGPYSLDLLQSQGVERMPSGNGNRSGSCIYWIQEADTCFFDPENPPSGPDGWVFNTARAGSIDWLTCGCCPGDDEGTWSWNTINPNYPPPPGGNLSFISALSEDTMVFKVSKAGVYTLKYEWGTPYNSYVQTEYKFFSPYYFQDLYADSVCGLCTDVHVEVSAYYGHYNAYWDWKLVNECTEDTVYLVEGDDFPALEELTYFQTEGQTHPITNDTLQVVDQEVCAPDYGTWKLIINIEGGECFPTSDTIYIEYSVEPTADAGDDVEVCDDLCTTLYAYPGTWFENTCYQAANYSTTWVQLSGPGTLSFDPADAETTYVCRTDDCSYGQYEIEFQVVNGECYDSDTMLLNFYEEPTAEAGEDQHLCDQLCFTLLAEAYPYCSDPIAEERYGYWTYLNPEKGPGTVTITDASSDTTGVCIDLPNECPWGVYSFIWTEVNGTCEDSDTVDIYLYQQPVADAGEDSVTTCFIDGCFTVYGAAFEYCSDTIGFRSHTWEVTSAPAGVDAFAEEVDDYVFQICPEGECIWGEYEVVLYESNNGICTDYDTIHFFLFEPPTAQAADDFDVDCYAECFSLMALPFSYCSAPAPEWGERYGEWTKVAGPAAVTFDDENLPNATACFDVEADCPWGVYTFEWAEHNGDCVDMDTLVVTYYEPPTALAGADYEECIDWAYSATELWYTFDATAYEYCQTEGLDNYSYWSKCDGPGYVTWYENENNPNAYVNVSCFGCYCFVYHEVNGTCESTDTVHVCFYEHPYVEGRDLSDSTCTELCYDLGNLGVVPYEYDECENYNTQGWVMTAGVGEPTYTPDATAVDAEVCVDEYGCYTFDFIQWNGMEECADTVTANLWFFEQPDAYAGEDAEFCGNCYEMQAVPYSFVVNECHPAADATHFWMYFSYIAPEPYCDNYTQYWPCYTIDDIYDPNAEICLCFDDYYGMNYGTYGFIWTEINGTCQDQDTVWITYNKIPDELPLEGCVSEAQCGFYGPGPINRDVIEGCGCVDCWYPEDTVMTVCAYTSAQFCIDWECLYIPGKQGFGPIPGYTYEWSFTGPAGSYFEADPLYYDCECGWQGSPCVYIGFGECCDTARLYLTITSPEGCVTTEEWKFYVQHPPDATISGAEIAEVGTVFEYSVPEPANPCYLYVWSVQHCGEIVYGQGTGTIGVLWTDYNENGGWGLVGVEVHDTCTCCCNMDELYVRVLPQNSLGDGALEGYVYYNNSVSTPLNGVKLTLWNAGVPIFETYSFNDIDGGNGVGYYAFEGINETTEFGVTAEYTAPWYGANATDALGVELKTIQGYPYTPWNNVQIEAADVNNSGAMNATDALWIKQRAIAMVTQFPAGDWAFEPDMSSVAGTYNVYTLNYGDVNKSNIPSSNKEMPAIELVNDGVINVTPGELFDLPIRVADAVSLGAITLNLGYNSALLEVVEVNAVEGALTNANSTNIAMAWSNVSPLVLNNNDAIVTLRLKALGEITSSDVLFNIEAGTEFADPNALVLDDVTLKSFGISTEPVATDYFLSYNRPNPFSTTTQIEYTLPENGKVRLSVVDLLGQELDVLVNQTQSAGTYTVQYSAAGVAPGVYIYKITVEGETRNFVDTRRMVISQ